MKKKKTRPKKKKKPLVHFSSPLQINHFNKNKGSIHLNPNKSFYSFHSCFNYIIFLFFLSPKIIFNWSDITCDSHIFDQ